MTNMFVVVIKNNWSEFEVEGVYSTFENASEAIGKLEPMNVRVNAEIHITELK